MARFPRGSVLQCANPLVTLLLLGLGRGLQGEVELDFGKPTAHAVGRGTLLVVAEGNLGDQFVTSGVGEVIVQVLVAIQVDLGGQVAMVIGRDEEVNVRRTLAMPAR